MIGTFGKEKRAKELNKYVELAALKGHEGAIDLFEEIEKDKKDKKKKPN